MSHKDEEVWRKEQRTKENEAAYGEGYKEGLSLGPFSHYIEVLTDSPETEKDRCKIAGREQGFIDRYEKKEVVEGTFLGSFFGSSQNHNDSSVETASPEETSQSSNWDSDSNSEEEEDEEENDNFGDDDEDFYMGDADCLKIEPSPSETPRTIYVSLKRELSEDEQIELMIDIQRSQNPIPRTTNHRVIINGEVVSETYVIHLPDGDVICDEAGAELAFLAQAYHLLDYSEEE